MYTERQKLTPPQVADAWGVKVDKVVHWIRTGELRAINAATDPNGQRPRYLIDRDDLEAFERRREVMPTNKPVRRKPRKPTGVIQFFK